MKRFRIVFPVVLTLVLWTSGVFAWDGSGSTGALGAFNPTTSMAVTLPNDGVLNYTTINIPSGVTITFTKNSANSPVYMLATGDVNIAGAINVSGGSASGVTPGKGGPGGFDGGFGGAIPLLGSRGYGPGAGGGGAASNQAGAGGGYGSNGTTWSSGAALGATYGNERIYPLTGGSGGGGGSASGSTAGGGGGGGGGAIVIASSTSINLTGSINANGGAGVGTWERTGGSGSGGAVKLIANTISGEGSISSLGTAGWITGGYGRIRLEAITNNRTSGTNPAYTFGAPSSIFMPNPPSISIMSIAGQAVPLTATGSYNQPDITLDSATANPVNVMVSATNIPNSTLIKVWVTPQYGPPSSVDAMLSGSDAASTATAAVTLSRTYANVITAETTFTVQQAFYLDGEKVDKIFVADTLGEGSSLFYITESGRRIKADQITSLN